MSHSEAARGPRAAMVSRGACVVTLLGSLLAALPGCEKPIFRADEPRSQYDRLDMVRNTREPSYLPDEFGNLRPNLTGRLSGLR